jgi:hypothetical protein
VNPGLEAKTVFERLQRIYPGRFADGQLRTLQRRVKWWRATQGPAKEVFFAQQHPPRRLSASDFTYMNELGITIQGQSFSHLIYHFVLTAFAIHQTSGLLAGQLQGHRERIHTIRLGKITQDLTR